MARALDGIDRFTWQGGGFDAWLYGIVRNVVRELSRARWRNAGPVTDERPATERGPEEHAVAVDDTGVAARGVLPVERRGSGDPRTAGAGRADVRGGRPAPRQATWDDPHGPGEGVAAIAGRDGGGARCPVTTSSAISWRSSSTSPRRTPRRNASPPSAPAPSGRERVEGAVVPVAWFAVAAAVVALLAGAVVVRAVTRRRMARRWSSPGRWSGPTANGAADLRVVATGIGRVVELDTDALPILPTGELYEVWFVGPGDTPDTPNRISAGTFHPDRAGRTDVQPDRRRRPGAVPGRRDHRRARRRRPRPTRPGGPARRHRRVRRLRSAALDESAIRQLFAAPPTEFVAARNELVKALRREKRREEATAVAALRRPGWDDWALNVVAAEQPPTVDAFTGAAARRARGAGGGDRRSRRSRRPRGDEVAARPQCRAGRAGHRGARACRTPAGARRAQRHGCRRSPAARRPPRSCGRRSSAPATLRPTTSSPTSSRRPPAAAARPESRRSRRAGDARRSSGGSPPSPRRLEKHDAATAALEQAEADVTAAEQALRQAEKELVAAQRKRDKAAEAAERAARALDRSRGVSRAAAGYIRGPWHVPSGPARSASGSSTSP